MRILTLSTLILFTLQAVATPVLIWALVSKNDRWLNRLLVAWLGLGAGWMIISVAAWWLRFMAVFPR